MSERPPGGDGDDRDLTSGDPLRSGPEDDDEAAPAPPPPPPWRRDPPAGGAAPAEESWRPYPEDDVPEPEPELEPEPEPEPDLPPAQPRTGSIPPPSYAGSESPRAIPPGATVTPHRPAAAPVPDERWVLAGWWRRAVAFVVDGLVVGVVATLIIILITAAAGGVGFLGGDATGYGGIVLGLLFSTLIATAVALFYAPFYMARTNGQTLGKQLMSIRVVRANGEPIEFLWAVVREVVVKTFLFAGIGGSVTFGLAWVIDCLWPLWDDENRALHDLIVNSRVVRA